MTPQLVTINSRKYDGEIHRSWQAELIEREATLLTFLGRFKFDVSHPDLGFIRRGTISYEYYWLDRWYNVFRFHEPDGEFRNFYCNINKPPTFTENTLDYIDLDIDLLVTPDWNISVLDKEEFARNAVSYRYGEDTIQRATQTVIELRGMVESRDFPFHSTSTITPGRQTGP